MSGDAFDFHSVLRVDGGRLFWVVPPKNHAEKAGREAGYICRGGAHGNKDYWHIRVFGRTFKRSRVIFYMTRGRWPTPCVDHINGESMDDRPENLRECTHRQNAANRKQSGRLPRGVIPTRQGRFMARVSVDGRARSFGTFDTIAEASDRAASVRLEVFGEFA